jgi:hypothetical protein
MSILNGYCSHTEPFALVGARIGLNGPLRRFFRLPILAILAILAIELPFPCSSQKIRSYRIQPRGDPIAFGVNHSPQGPGTNK